jgi:hypothetical protein
MVCAACAWGLRGKRYPCRCTGSAVAATIPGAASRRNVCDIADTLEELKQWTRARPDGPIAPRRRVDAYQNTRGVTKQVVNTDKAKTRLSLTLLVSVLAVGPPVGADLYQYPRIDEQLVLNSQDRVTTPAPPTTANLYDPLILEMAPRYRVDPDLIKAIIRVSSNFNPTFLAEREGKVGLMGVPIGHMGAQKEQHCPGLTVDLQHRDLIIPRYNLDVGVNYLRKLLDCYDGNVRLALAAWQAGDDAVENAGGIPADVDVIEFIGQVLSAREEYLSGHTAHSLVTTALALPGTVPLARQEIARRAALATVTVVVEQQQGSRVAQGSGFAVTSSLVVTNAHVIGTQRKGVRAMSRCGLPQCDCRGRTWRSFSTPCWRGRASGRRWSG